MNNQNNNIFLFYIGHPAHFHNFSIIAEKLLNKGHSVLFAVRKRDILIDLIQSSQFDYVFMSNKKKNGSKVSLIWSILNRQYEMWKIIRDYKPDILAGTDIVITHLAKIFKIPSIILCDDDSSVVPLMAKYGFRFASAIVCPEVCDVSPYNKKKIGYKGLQKLIYLHPKYFSPDINLIKKYIDVKQKYFLIRLVKLTAHHDNNINGINNEVLDNIISELKTKGNIYISCERDIPSKYNKYKINNIPPNLIHHIMSFSDLLISDSQSMTVESCILGIPSIRFNNWIGKISVLEELEKKYKLTFSISTNNEKQLINKIKELTNDINIKNDWTLKKDEMLKDMIDVSDFITDVLENFK